MVIKNTTLVLSFLLALTGVENSRAQAQFNRMYGLGNPFELNDLPSGRMKSDLGVCRTWLE